MGAVCCNIGYLVALMTFCDQQATGINNTNVQRELGPVSQGEFNLVRLSLGYVASLDYWYQKAGYGLAQLKV